ncbi:hypothetical protein [Roseomonas xinghualingensis]|uniref:hypothetical protein n=1 Tax=Roseomonas xinghualingensis TaxID=2986475 RepID=UPI0021F13727|nr:hypothetical protein [Roseomonas sp. SXEYE001]MCV4209226.1 hypothetical protein [Roseomonas sp. SXEYE001]
MNTEITTIPIITADTITKLPPEANGAVILSGSHGGRYPGYLTAKANARAVILNDAGLGKEDAGIGSLPYLEALGIAAATVSHLSCRIGDTADMRARGVISHANAPARAVSVAPGMNCDAAAGLLRKARHVRTTAPVLGEARGEVPVPGGARRILLLDSASLVLPEDAGQIIVTGSHGGLVGGVPSMALRVEGFAGVFHDAGIGIEDARTTRLPALDGRGIASFTVSATSARIGDAASVFHDGVISVVNETARRLGAAPGMHASEVLLNWARRS